MRFKRKREVGAGDTDAGAKTTYGEKEESHPFQNGGIRKKRDHRLMGTRRP